MVPKARPPGASQKRRTTNIKIWIRRTPVHENQPSTPNLLAFNDRRVVDAQNISKLIPSNQLRLENAQSCLNGSLASAVAGHRFAAAVLTRFIPLSLSLHVVRWNPTPSQAIWDRHRLRYELDTVQLALRRMYESRRSVGTATSAAEACGDLE